MLPSRSGLLEDPRAVAIATYVALGIGLVPVVVGILDTAQTRAWATVTPLVELMLFVGIVAYRLVPRSFPVAVEPTRQFHPFAHIEGDDVWRRPADVDRVFTAFTEEQDTLPLMVGTSGVGKSTLIRSLLSARIKEVFPESDYKVIETYGDLAYDMTEYLRKHAKDQSPPVLVFDQFEQWLAHLRQSDTETRQREQAWFVDFVRTSLDTRAYLLMVALRKEWFYDLRFLGPLAPPLSEVFDLRGVPASDRTDEARTKIANRIVLALDTSNRVADELLDRLGDSGHLLPLETQIVGATLERERIKGRTVDADHFDVAMHGVGGCIESFFKGTLAGADNRRVCFKVLCALSAKTRFRQREDLGNILHATFEKEEDVREAIEFLVQQNLVIRRGSASYELAHDYLAEFFNAKSGEELNPTERDNIWFHLEAGPNQSDQTLIDVANGERLGFPLGRAVVSILLLFMAIRFLYFGAGWTLAGPNVAQPVHGKLFDAAYIPVFIAHGVWITYIGIFYDSIFRRIRETRLARCMSRMVVLNLIPIIVSGALVPYCWWLGISWGGFVLAIKLISLSQRKDLNKTARERLAVFGSTTLFNLMFLGALSIAMLVVSFSIVHGPSRIHHWVEVNCGLSLLMTWGCFALGQVHVSKPGISQLVGLVGRPLKAPVPRPEVY